MITLLIFGFLCGTLASILGVGSSLMLLPLLIYVYPFVTGHHLDIHMIAATTLTLTFFSSSMAAIRYHHFRLIPYRYALSLGIFGALASFIGGSYVSQFADRFFMLILFAGIAIFSFIVNLFPATESSRTEPSWIAVVFAMITMSVLGMITGIVGIGGMAIMIPYLYRVLNLSIRQVIGSTTFAGAFIALFGLLGKVSIGYMDWSIAIPVAIGGTLGGLTGSSFTKYYPEKMLRFGMNTVLFVVIVTVLVDIAR